MKLVTVLGASALALVAGIVACSSDTTTTTPGGATSSGGTSSGGGVQGPGEGTGGTSGSAANAYPTTNIGTKAGKTIDNLQFLGYPDADVEGGLKTIKLEQFYDPSGKTTKLIHIQAAGVWCSACRNETTALVPAADELKEKKVVWLVAMVEGSAVGTPSKESDLKPWIDDFNSPFTHLLDPGEQVLAGFFQAGALPWNINVDATTMKIISSSAGGPDKKDAILSDIDEALAEVGK